MDHKITRKDFLRTAAWGGASMLLTGFRGDAFAVQGPPLDVLIKGGQVVDGSGKAAYAADVAIRGGRIVDIGQLAGAKAATVIDAAGQFVSPGLIDPHAHEEILMLADPVLEKFVRQGVTTLINGNCGHSVTPYKAKNVLEYYYREALISYKRSQMNVDWEGVDGYAKVLDRSGSTVNSAVLLGYGGICWSVMKKAGGHERKPTAAEMKEIERLVNQGLEQGAVGMSTGLAYRPCYYADTDELIQVSKILAKHDAVYASHTRPAGNQYAKLSGGAEAVEVGAQARCRVQISHFGGRTQSALDIVTNGNARGVVTLADVIPQSLSHRRASNRMVEALMVFYPDAFDMSRDQLKALLRAEASRAAILKNVQFFNTDKNLIVIVRALTPKHEPSVGKSIVALAKDAGKSPDDLYIDLVLDEDNPVVFTFDGNRNDGRRGEIAAVQRAGRGGGQGEPPLAQGAWTKHPQFGPGSDTLPVDMDDPYGWYEHQRRGAFVGYFKQAKANGVALEEAVRKATSMPAEHFRVKDRGVLAKGKVADVMIFDPDKLSFPSPAEGDANDPHPMASGVSAVVVNGTVVLENAKLTGKKPGKVLL